MALIGWRIYGPSDDDDVKDVVDKPLPTSLIMK